MQVTIIFLAAIFTAGWCLQCSPECRPGATCCSEENCSDNSSDSEVPAYIGNQKQKKVSMYWNYDIVAGCECMIGAREECVAPGEDLTLVCDAGGSCVHHCSWETPLGHQCSWSEGSGYNCPDSGLSLDTNNGQCRITVTAAQYADSGVWTCKVNPSIHYFIGIYVHRNL